MTFSALGISVESRGVDEGARKLDAVTAAANRVDAAVSKIAPETAAASAGLQKMGRAAQIAENSLSNLSSRTLTGFNALAHRAAQEAEFIASQIERMTFRDVRANDISAYGAELDRLRAKYNPLFAASKQYEQSLDELNDAQRVGAINAREYGESLDALNSKYQRATEAANGLARAEKYAAAERAAAAARSSQSAINTQMGVRTDFGGAARAEDIAAYGAQLDALRAKFNPIFAASKRYEAELNELNQAQRMGAITAREYDAALVALNAGMQASAAATNQMGVSAGMARMQANNLAYQVQDIGMMMAMGQNPFMLLAQQLPQVTMHGGKLNGIMGAIKQTVSGLVSPLGLATTAFVLLGSAAISYFRSGSDAINKIDDALTKHEANIERLKSAWGNAASGIEAYRKESERVSQLRAASSASELRLGARAGIEGVLGEVTGVSGYDQRTGEIVHTLRSEYSEFADAITKLRESARDPQDLINFRNEVAAMWESNPTAETLKFAQALLDMTDDAARAALALGATSDAIQKINERFRSFASQGLANANDTLRSFIPDLTTDAEKIERAYQTAIGAASRLGVTARAAEGIILAAQRDRAKALDELTRKEEVRRGLYELDYKSITARTAAEKANIAAERERLNLSGQALSEQEKARRIEEARTLSLRQSHREATEALRQRTEAEREAIAQMELDISLVGKSAGEVARLSTEYELLAEAQRAAYEEGRSVSDSEIDRIRKHAAEVGKLAEKYAALQAMSDISFDISIMGLSEGDQRIMSDLRQMGIEANSAYGQMVGGAMRYRDAQKELQDELKATNDLGKDAFMSILDLMYEAGDIGDKLIGIFANIGKQFAKMGMERLWKSISGGGGSIFDGVSGSASGSFSPVQTAQVGREIGNAIAPSISSSLNDNLQSYAAAIRKIESGSYQGNYGAVGPMVKTGRYAGDHAYGAYQVMGKNIASWTKEATGASLSIQQFLNDRAAQDKVFASKFGASLDKFGTFADATSVWFSGRPLSRAGNSSDGYNTVPQYVQKAESALAGYNPQGLKVGVSAGVVDASRKIAHMPEMAGNTSGFAQTGGSQGGGMLQNALGIGGAAFGAFAGGYQSGDPIMGGISGAMSGLGAAPMLSAMGMGAAAGPIGIIGGAIIGLVGGILGQAKKRREELKKAQEELESQMGAITKLIADSTGNFMGTVETSIVDRMDEFSKAMKLADKARNFDLGKELAEAQTQFMLRTINSWRATFDATLKSLEEGFGFESEFLSGFDAVEKMRESLVGFVNDAKLMAGTNDEIIRGLLDRQNMFKEQEVMFRQANNRTVGENENQATYENKFVDGYIELGNQLIEHGVQAFKSTGEQLYSTLEELSKAATDAGLIIDELGNVTRAAANDNTDYAASIMQAQQAAQQAALTALSGAKEYTEIEKAMEKMYGVAAALPQVLLDLGMSAEEAAEAVRNELTKAINELRKSVQMDVQRSINELSDFGFLNDLVSAQASYQERMRDLAAAGLDGGLAVEELRLRVKQLARDAELTDDQLSRLAGVFPEIGAALLGAIGMADGSGSGLADAKAALDEAKSALRSAYEEERRAIEAVISRHQALIKSLRAFLDDLRLDTNLSPLDPYERLQEAQRQFQETAMKALAGDEDALGKIEDASRAYLTEAKAWWGTSTQYFEVFKQVEDIVAQALTVSETQLTEAERQLAALERQISSLIDIDTGVKSVKDAIADLNKAQEEYDAAKLANDEYQNSLFERMLEMMADQRVALGNMASAMSYLNANTDVMNAIKSGNDFGTGSSDLGVLANAHWAKWGKDEGRSVPLQGQTPGQRYMGINSDVYNYYLARGDIKDASDIERLAKYHWENFGRAEGRMGGFMSGGFTGMGAVGQVAGYVHGQEFVAHAEATRRWRPQLEAMNAGTYRGQGDASMVAEIRALREQVASLEKSNAEVTIAAAQGQISATDETTNAVNRQTGSAWRASRTRAA